MAASHPLVAAALPASVALTEGSGGLPRLDVTTPFGSAEVYLHGAHVSAWHPRHGAPVLWLSDRSLFQPDKPIRGGVPVCFPWFGAHRIEGAPAHGFARLADWTLAEAKESADGSVLLVLTLAGQSTTPAWPHRFRLAHRIAIGADLTMTLEVHNAGDQPFVFEEALHSYFAVSDIERIAITGLGGVEYLDKIAGMLPRRQTDDAIRFSGETDRIYLDTPATCIVEDPGNRRRIVIATSRSQSTVIWNPWIGKARAMPDFGDDEWRRMVCVETANVGAASVRLDAGATHTMTAAVSVEAPAAEQDPPPR